MLINYENKELRIFNINGSPFWVVLDICSILGFSNVSQQIKKIPKDDLTICEVIDSLGRNQKVTCVNEPGLYRLIMRAQNSEKAIKFQNWIYYEVLPSIRKTGSYSIDKNTFIKHTDEKYQKLNSKLINAKSYQKGGIDAIIEYNVKNCIIHSGKTPNEIKKQGIKTGLKKSKCNSAKEVLRNIKPEIACSMSFADYLTQLGYKIEDVSSVTIPAIEVYNQLLKLGIKPIEIKD